MPDMRRDVEHLAGTYVDDLLPIIADRESERTLEDVRQLLVLVIVLRDDAALLEVHVREHHAVARAELAAQER